MNSLQVALGH